MNYFILFISLSFHLLRLLFSKPPFQKKETLKKRPHNIKYNKNTLREKNKKKRSGGDVGI